MNGSQDVGEQGEEQQDTTNLAASEVPQKRKRKRKMSAAALRAERLREKKKLDEKVPVVDISSTIPLHSSPL